MIKIAIILSLTLTILFLIVISRSTDKQVFSTLPEKAEILDMHCHVAGIGAGGSGAFVSDEMRNSWKYHVYLKAFGVTEKQVMAQGDGLIVQKISEQLAASEMVGSAVVLALDGAINRSGQLDPDLTESYIPNNFLAREAAKYDNLYFGASVNPYRRDALDRLDQVKRDGAVLIKWLPAIQHIDPADPELRDFYLKLVALDLPLLTHAGDEHAFTSADNSLGDPQKLRLALDLGVTVIVAHAATSGTTEGEDNMQRLLPLFAEYPNLYSDISALTQVNKLRFVSGLLAAEIEPQRLLYGTDFPLIATGLASPLFSALKLKPGKVMALLKSSNPWDQDLRLKLAHGFSTQSLSSAHQLLIK